MAEYRFKNDLDYMPSNQPKLRLRKAPHGECDCCNKEGLNFFHPPHDASERCESGKHPHCSCDTCF
jgi:hypothetical protein